MYCQESVLSPLQHHSHFSHLSYLLLTTLLHIHQTIDKYSLHCSEIFLSPLLRGSWKILKTIWIILKNIFLTIICHVSCEYNFLAHSVVSLTQRMLFQVFFHTHVWLPSILPLRWEPSKTSCVWHLWPSVSIPLCGVWDRLRTPWSPVAISEVPKCGVFLTQIQQKWL